MIERDGDAVRVRGALTIATVGEALSESAAFFAVQGDWTLDFSSLAEVDSAAVALMLEWMRQAAQRGRPLRFLNLPDNLLCLLKVYDVQDLFASE